MNIEELLNINKVQEEKIIQLEKELNDTREHLKRYTAPKSNKRYYENHKKEIIKKVMEYKEKTNYKYIVSPEKKKEYNKIAYQKRKEKEREREREKEKEIEIKN